MCWEYFHGRPIEVADLVFIDESPLLVDRLITPSLPATARTAPLLSAFALRYILRLSSCRSTEGFIILPCLTSRSKELNSAWPLRSVRITRLHRYYGPLRHPLAFGPFPVSAVIGPTSLQGFLPGASRTSPVSIVSLLPCRRHYPAGVDYPLSQPEIAHAAFAELLAARPPVLDINEACSAFTHVATQQLAHQPKADFVGRLHHVDYS